MASTSYRRTPIRAATFRRWLHANLARGQRQELAQYGADAGWPGLTYTRDTVRLFDRFAEEIWAIVVEGAESNGTSVGAYLGTFRGDLTNWDTFRTIMVWHAAESICMEEVA